MLARQLTDPPTHQPTNPPTDRATDLPTYLLKSYRATYLPAHQPISLLANLPTTLPLAMAAFVHHQHRHHRRHHAAINFCSRHDFISCPGALLACAFLYVVHSPPGSDPFHRQAELHRPTPPWTLCMSNPFLGLSSQSSIHAHHPLTMAVFMV